MADASKTLEIIISAKDEASKALQGLTGQIGSFYDQIKPGAAAMTGLGVATGIAAKSFVDAAAQMEQWDVAFTTMLGNADRADSLLSDLSEFAKKTPFDLPQVIEGSKRLIAFGTSADDVIPRMTMLGNIASGVGREKMPDLIRAFGQIQAKGRLMGQELLQLTETGIPVIEELAKVTGHSAQEISTNVADLGITSEQVTEALSNMAGEGGMFFNLMEKQSKTTGGQISNLGDNIFRLKVALGDTLLPTVNSFLAAITPLIEQLARWSQAHPQLITAIIGLGLAIGALGSAILVLGPIFAGLNTMWLLLTAAATPFLTVITAITTFLGGPLTVAIGLIIAILTALYVAWTTNWLGIRDTTMSILTQIGTFFQNLSVTLSEIMTQLVSFITTKFMEMTTNAINWASQLVTSVISWMTQLPPRILAILEQTKTFIITKLTEAWMWIAANVSTWPGKIQSFISSIPSRVGQVFEDAKTIVLDKMSQMYEGVLGWWDKIKGVLSSIKDAAENAYNSVKKGVEAAKGKLGFQHGGFVPGGYGQAVPAVLHGGERVIPRVGTDVNPRSGGGIGNVSINFSGAITMDSDNRVQELADKIIEILGRQNELAARGVSF